MALLNLISEITNKEELMTYNEDEIKQAVILPILQTLGWNIFKVSEVTPEYSLQSKRVDYALCSEKKPIVFIEAKRPSTSLDNHQEQLLSYSFHAGVRLAVLTNGISWWFYLPLQEGHWEKRKFYSVNVFDQDLSNVASRFEEFLNKDNVSSGKAEDSARSILKSRDRIKDVHAALPKAWALLISEPDDFLVELLKDKVEDICGFVPTADELIQYLAGVPMANDEKPICPTMTPKEPVTKTSATQTDKLERHIEPGTVGQDNMVEEIIKALRSRGGRARKFQVEEIILEKYSEEFKKAWYQASVAHGVPRWKHNIAWAKEKLKHEGLIKPPSESGRGMWELTDKANRNSTNI